MTTINELLAQAEQNGYAGDNAEQKVCQDIVVFALSKSSLSRNVTMKGGVVMRCVSGDARRATQDIDIDFIKYSLSDESIGAFIESLNCLPDFQIEQYGRITELKQQDYRGKRVLIRISDQTGDAIESKIDLGVHKHLNLRQNEYCFDISFTDEGASLLINSYEQMFVEKLRSLLKFGEASTRQRDIFDMLYLTKLIDKNELKNCLDILVFKDEGMRENTMNDVVKRVSRAFESDYFKNGLARAKNNWMQISVEDATTNLLNYIRTV